MAFYWSIAALRPFVSTELWLCYVFMHPLVFDVFRPSEYDHVTCAYYIDLTPVQARRLCREFLKGWRGARVHSEWRRYYGGWGVMLVESEKEFSLYFLVMWVHARVDRMCQITHTRDPHMSLQF